jgi:hypothetical protein
MLDHRDDVIPPSIPRTTPNSTDSEIAIRLPDTFRMTAVGLPNTSGSPITQLSVEK